MSICRELQAHWKAQGVDSSTPVDNDDIRAFEQKFGVVLPHDLREYFLALNGMDIGHDGSMDNEMISSWRLADIERERLERPLEPSNLFAFGDWSIDACRYAIALAVEPSAETPVFLLCDERPLRVADSFTDFAKAYLRNDARTLYGVGIA
jgi:hypothetical protein